MHFLSLPPMYEAIPGRGAEPVLEALAMQIWVKNTREKGL